MAREVQRVPTGPAARWRDASMAALVRRISDGMSLAYKLLKYSIVRKRDRHSFTLGRPSRYGLAITCPSRRSLWSLSSMYSDQSLLSAIPTPPETTSLPHMHEGCVYGAEPFYTNGWAIYLVGMFRPAIKEILRGHQLAFDIPHVSIPPVRLAQSPRG